MRYTLYILIILMLALTSVSFGETDQQKLTPTQIFDRFNPSVVLIIGLEQAQESTVLGTGFLVSSTGVFITNRHVIEGVFPAQVKLSNGDVYDNPAVVATDARKDIAILKIKGFNLPTVTLGDSDSVTIGSQVTVIGNPKGLEGSITDGLVSGKRDTGEGYNVLQISAAISPGSSGSPVFNEFGEVIGIATATLVDGQSINFAIPINYARGLISEKEELTLEEFSKSSKPKLFDNEKNNLKVSNDEWGKRIALIYHKILEGNDLFYLGYNTTIEPHKKKLRLDKFFISTDLYVAQDKFNSVVKELGEFIAEDQELVGFQDNLLTMATKYASACKLEIELLKTIPQKGVEEYNVREGEAVALNKSANEEGVSLRSLLGEIFDKYCPNQKILLPISLQQKPVESPPVRLGIFLGSSHDEVWIIGVQESTAAAKAGLKIGDVILGVENSTRFVTFIDFYDFLRTKKPGDEVAFEILRAGKKQVFKIKLMPKLE
jgi:S1-C subfamily serine protease